jgi:hypothetical protein
VKAGLVWAGLVRARRRELGPTLRARRAVSGPRWADYLAHR